MVTHTFQDITHPDDLATDLNNFQLLVGQDIDIYTVEKRYLQKNKTIVWVNLTVQLVRNEIGDPKYFIFVVEDISERKQAKDRFKLLIEQTSDVLRNSSNKKADQSFRKKEKNGKLF